MVPAAAEMMISSASGFLRTVSVFACRPLSTITVPKRPPRVTLDSAAAEHEERIRRGRQLPIPGLTNEKSREKRNRLFDEAKKRQIEAVKRIEKIEVQYVGVFDQEEECVLMMNKGLSTPYNCAQHIGEILCNDAVVAFVNGRPWDMHRPLQESCEIRMQMFRDENPHVANRALWRTGSFLLSYMAERVLKDEYYVEVHSWPPPDIRTGSYVCDVDLKIPEWSPRTDELLAMNKVIARVISQRVQFERVDVPAETALEMFEDNRFKREQIPNIAEKFVDRPGFVPVYRILDHVDISGGPLISHTGQVGRHQLTAIHQIDCKGIGSLYRLQGIALPVTQALNFYTWNILLQRAKNLNVSAMPGDYLRTQSIEDDRSNEPGNDQQVVDLIDEPTEERSVASTGLL